jgi:excisionase family DNA binding protein
MAGRKSPTLTARATAERSSSASNVYSAQIVADFCEVDLKTVHHWADRGKVPHFRTDGRHLRFRRNDVVRFLRTHGYPLPDQLVRARPTVALALPNATLDGAPLSLDELGKRLGSRFTVKRHSCAAHALAHLVADAPDAVILAGSDGTLGASAIAALKDDPATSWIVFVAIPMTADGDASWSDRADIVVSAPDITKLPGEVARALAVV